MRSSIKLLSMAVLTDCTAEKDYHAQIGGILSLPFDLMFIAILPSTNNIPLPSGALALLYVVLSVACLGGLRASRVPLLF